MSRIQLLSEEVASQVAAGEVVERPASVVKELVENSIDAGADRIEVLVNCGGISLIRVTDNGCGMDRDDALLCLERHATSKIRTGQDLATVSTLGFRGEAIPSIASVSRFTLSTREKDAVGGTEIVIAGGRIQAVRDGGEAPGTTVEVRSLFYNLPARRKFLRTEKTEASHVEHHLHLQAIGHPDVGFTLVKDGRTVFQLPPVTDLLSRICDLQGAAMRQSLIAVEYECDMRITGWIGKPGVSRATRDQQLIFVNGRAVENASINHGLREGYHTALMKGQFPVTYLFLEIEPSLVDVNVHPAKREVRFHNGNAVRDAVSDAVRLALEKARPDWSQQFSSMQTTVFPPPALLKQEEAIAHKLPDSAPQSAQPELPPAEPELPGSMAPPTLTTAAVRFEPHEPPAPQPVSPTPAHRTDTHARARPAFRIHGVLGKLYVLMENEKGLVLVDQHAAHERILFEELRRRMEAQGVPAQRLLLSHTIQVTPRDRDWILSNLDTLQRMGIGLEEFGPVSFKLDSLPAFLSHGDPAQTLMEIIDELREAGRNASRLRLGEDVIATTVCRHAVKANDVLRMSEIQKLIEDLLACELPYCCPHGRPTMIQISYLELEKKFGRKA